MKKLLLSICTACIMCFATDKCETYQEAYALRAILSQDWENLYPMMSFCFLEGFINALKPSFDEFDWETARKRIDGMPTDKGVQLIKNMQQSNELAIQAFIRSGRFSNGSIIPCFLTNDMKTAIGTYLWNPLRKSLLQKGMSPNVLRAIILDQKTCIDWGSHRITKQEINAPYDDEIYNAGNNSFTETNSTPVEKEMTDSRDGKTYKIVKIDDDVWMAENLNYKTKKSRCYDNKTSNCKKYGQLYDMDEAQTICPTGWKLPTRNDMRNLYSKGDEKPYSMQAKGQKKWSKATDAYGFSAYAAGVFTQGKFLEQGNLTGFWLEQECEGCSIYSWVMNSDKGSTSSGDQDFSFSVRCIKGISNNQNFKKKEKKAVQIIEGTTTDPRDGKSYKTVQIGNQTWMAENLNYKSSGSYCYNNNEENCAKYGRLYTWFEAMGNSTCSAMDKPCPATAPVQGVCPTGWHLPSSDEFWTLYNKIKADDVDGTLHLGMALRAPNGWEYQKDDEYAQQQYNKYGFHALPGGYRSSKGFFSQITETAYFWASDESVSGGMLCCSNAYSMRMHGPSDYPEIMPHGAQGNKVDAYSVRCIKGMGNNDKIIQEEKTKTVAPTPVQTQPAQPAPAQEASTTTSNATVPVASAPATMAPASTAPTKVVATEPAVSTSATAQTTAATEAIAPASTATVEPTQKQEQATEAAESTYNIGDLFKKIKWQQVVSVSAALAGGGLAYYFNKKAKDATANPPANAAEYQKGYDDAGKNQTYRNISIGLAAVGLVAFGITFIF